MDIIKTLSQEISKRIGDQLTIIAICGAADLGKSFISRQLVSSLEQLGRSADHLTLDSYLMDRKLRKEGGISGYQSEAYMLSDAVQDLEQLKRGQSINYHPYDHQFGKIDQSITFTISELTDVLFFDGLHTLYPSFRPLIDTSLFIHTGDKHLRQIRHDADISKRGYTKEYSSQISDQEMDLYQRCVAPYQSHADYLLFLKSMWDYELSRN